MTSIVFESLLAPQYLQWLLQGFAVTVALSLLVVLAAMPLGFALCIARISSAWWWARPARAWLSVFRNTPLLVQLFFWYFGVSAWLPDSWKRWLNAPHRLELWWFGLHWPPFEYLAGFVGLALYSAAFIAEEFRAGVRGVPAGQVAAASALGLRPLQVWRHVILPQAVHNAFPPLLGQVMNIVKNSSLTMAIGVAELSYAARQVESQSFQAFQVFAVATALYVLTIAAVEVAGQYWKRRWHGARRSPAMAG